MIIAETNNLSCGLLQEIIEGGDYMGLSCLVENMSGSGQNRGVFLG